MRRRYVRGDERWEIEVGEESLTITHGAEIKRVENTYEAMGMPAHVAYGELVAALPPGFVEVVPDDPRAKQPNTLIAISARLVGARDAPDEQQWIGIDPAQANGPVFELFTSGSYEKAYDSLDEFLIDLKER